MQSLMSRIDEEQMATQRVQRQVKEMQLRIDELEETLEHERQSRSKVHLHNRSLSIPYIDTMRSRSVRARA